MIIPKNQGEYKIHYLHTIHKLKSEINLLQRETISRHLMHNTETHNTLNKDQHKRRKGDALSI